MIKIDEILDLWKHDSEVDKLKAHDEIIKIPMLHSKYIEILSGYRFASQKAKFEHIKMKKIRREYFLGSLDKETLDEYNWEQFDLKIGNKSNVDLYLDSDEFLIKLLEKKVYYDEGVFILEAIIKELHSRTFQLKEYLSYQKFLNGAY